MSMICTTAFPIFITGFRFFFAPLRINAMSFLKNETHAGRSGKDSLVLPGLRDNHPDSAFLPMDPHPRF